MVKEEKGGIGSFVAFLIGMAFGATVTLLLTPETGKETRKKLKRVLEEAHDFAVSKAKETLEQKKVQKEEEEHESESSN